MRAERLQGRHNLVAGHKKVFLKGVGFGGLERQKEKGKCSRIRKGREARKNMLWNRGAYTMVNREVWRGFLENSGDFG